MSTREVLTAIIMQVFYFSSLFNNKTTEQQPTSLKNETNKYTDNNRLCG